MRVYISLHLKISSMENGGGGGTCNEPTRTCAERETGCGYVH
ncbi:hypothetical protein [Elizabethkingia sp. YR214]|nr:hypothetical protein [Elizabethkingia sp. YR214]